MKCKIILTVQHFEGCPNGPAMLANAAQAAAGFPGIVEFREQVIETAEDARKYDFRGSPTLLINGEDYEGMPVPGNPVMSCRFYPAGVPGPAAICSKIKSITGG